MAEVQKVVDRFWSKVDKDGPTQPHMSSPCWTWVAAKFPRGYGKLGVNGVTCYAHRVAYQLHHGVDPGPLCVCHRCDNPSCVNPEHLFLGTQSDNLRDMTVKGRNGSQRHPERLRRGAGHPGSKLSERDVIEIRILAARGVAAREISIRFGVHRRQVGRILDGRSWAHVK